MQMQVQSQNTKLLRPQDFTTPKIANPIQAGVRERSVECMPEKRRERLSNMTLTANLRLGIAPSRDAHAIL